MSKVVHTLNVAYISVSVFALYNCSLHTPTVSIKAGEVHAVIPTPVWSGPPGKGGLMRQNAGKEASVSWPLPLVCPLLPVNLRCRSLLHC